MILHRSAPSSIAIGALACASIACGARTSLEAPGSGGAGSTTAVGGTSVTSDGSASSGGPTCDLADLSTWRTERFRDEGDYERAAVATSDAPFVALKPRNGDVFVARLTVSSTTGISLDERIDLPNAPLYPVALDADAKRFVMLTTTGLNWNGDVTLWRIDRTNGEITSTPLGDPPADPADTIDSALAIVGDQIVVAYGRPAQNTGVLELRDEKLAVVASQAVPSTTFYAAHVDDHTADVYVGPSTRFRATAGSLVSTTGDPAFQTIGGLADFVVEIGQEIRLRRGTEVWSAAWPHTQISPPAVLRTDGARAVFSLETELTAVLGHTTQGALAWMPIESAPDAPGAGLGLLPSVAKGRLGLFYLGLEIPHPEQPLRYFGKACD